MKFLKSLTHKDLSKEICVLRIDLNVEDTSNVRLKAVVPTLELLKKGKAKVVILSHEGRPILNQKLKIKNRKYKKFSLQRFTKILAKEIKQPIHFLDFAFPVSGKTFAEFRAKIDAAPAGSIFLLENVRFLPGEMENDAKLGENLASLGTFFVNDAFSVSHRAEASIAAITKCLPSYAGLRLEQEIESLKHIRDHYAKPLAVIFGGAKISDKISVIEKLYAAADYFLIGGGIANTFFYAEGLPLGNSTYEKIKISKKVLRDVGTKVILPADVVWADNRILDVGKNTVMQFEAIIRRARSIIWNGPLGLTEDKRFRKGSEAIARALLKSKAHIVVGGGETTMLFEKKKLPPNLFLSTGGGAMLEYLEGKKLPGIEALR